MSSHKSDLSDLQLITHLIPLNGLSIAKAAKVMNIQRSNLSVWLNGRQNVFSVAKIEGMLEALGISAKSEASTGIRLRNLSQDVIHRWQVEEGAQSLIDVLRTIESESSLDRLEIFQVNTSQQGFFNILRNQDGENGGWLMLVANRDTASQIIHYPLSPELLGFGTVAGSIVIPTLTWMGWWKEKTLPAPVFLEEISGVLDKISVKGGANDQNIERSQELVEIQLQNCQRTIKELEDIIRVFTDELHRVDPRNRLLDQIAKP